MPRPPRVTRTIRTTFVTVLCMDLETEKPYETTIVLPRVYKDEKKLYKAVCQAVDSSKRKAVHIVSSEQQEKLYGMTEEQFLEHAKELKDRNESLKKEEEN